MILLKILFFLSGIISISIAIVYIVNAVVEKDKFGNFCLFLVVVFLSWLLYILGLELKVWNL